MYHKDGDFSHKIDYGIFFQEISNLKGHQNRTTGSTVMAILLNGQILYIGGLAWGRVCACSLRMQPAQQACFWNPGTYIQLFYHTTWCYFIILRNNENLNYIYMRVVFVFSVKICFGHDWQCSLEQLTDPVYTTHSLH